MQYLFDSITPEFPQNGPPLTVRTLAVVWALLGLLWWVQSPNLHLTYMSCVSHPPPPPPSPSPVSYVWMPCVPRNTRRDLPSSTCFYAQHVTVAYMGKWLDTFPWHHYDIISISNRSTSPGSHLRLQFPQPLRKWNKLAKLWICPSLLSPRSPLPVSPHPRLPPPWLHLPEDLCSSSI